MRRLLFLFTFIASACLPALPATAQNDGGRPNVWQLLTLAEFPLVRKRDGVRYPAMTIAEYKPFREWIQNIENVNTGPEYFHLVAVAYNPDDLPIKSVELELVRDRKIGEYHDQGAPSLDITRERATWEGHVHIESSHIARLDGKTGTYVWFGPFSAHDLWMDLAGQDRWPWEVRYEVTARCDGCSSEDTTGASFTMIHAPLARDDQIPTGQP